VRVSGSTARKLYEKFGFLEIGRRKDYYTDPREDAIIMSLGPTRAAGEKPHTGQTAGVAF
jgi:ribosomal protein S18 acetylase RimI-like enzyme